MQPTTVKEWHATRDTIRSALGFTNSVFNGPVLVPLVMACLSVDICLHASPLILRALRGEKIRWTLVERDGGGYWHPSIDTSVVAESGLGVVAYPSVQVSRPFPGHVQHGCAGCPLHKRRRHLTPI